MNIRKNMTRKFRLGLCALSAAVLCGAARAEEPVGDAEAAEAADEEETAVVSGEFSLAFDTKYLSYGFVDNNEPIWTPSAELTFFDWFSLGAYGICDVTTYGRRAGYRDRAWKAIEFHPNATIAHSFGPDDADWLPTTVEISLNYDYEYIPRCCRPEDCSEKVKDTQYWTLEVSLPDLWCEPTFTYERDVMRDNGTYLQLELGHTFNLIEDTLDFRPSIAQGWGNAQRVRAYAERNYGYYYDEEEDEEIEDWLPYNHAALMDTMVKGEFTWTITDWLSLSAYVAYSDFLFDEGIRDAARNYESTGDWGHSWNVIGGLAITASF